VPLNPAIVKSHGSNSGFVCFVCFVFFVFFVLIVIRPEAALSVNVAYAARTAC